VPPRTAIAMGRRTDNLFVDDLQRRVKYEAYL